MRTLKIEEVTIVFVGSINPSIIQPYWLAKKGLINEDEAEAAKIQVIHDELTIFHIDWATIEVTPQRFQIKTKDEMFFHVMKDLGMNIFRKLKDTPLSKLGINYVAHYKMDEKTYSLLGQKLTPFSNWDGILETPKLSHIEIKDESRVDGFKGYKRIRISQSNLIDKFAVAININDHFESTNNFSGTEEILTILSKKWEDSHNESKAMSEKLWQNLDI